MGIRFFCPNGHKLNVKSYLAGKRGICPDCGVSFEIPFESTRESSRESKTIQRPEEPVPEPVTAPRPSEQFSGDFPLHLANVPGLAGETNDFTDKTPTESEGIVPSSEKSDSPEAADPFLAETEIVWYIQAPGGGPQYGPATGPVVQSWIKERRIGPKMLVWREGWQNWLEARNVFPELQAMFSETVKTSPSGKENQVSGPVTDEPNTLVQETNVKSTAKLTTRQEKQKRTKRKLFLVFGLATAILILGGLLIYLLNR